MILDLFVQSEELEVARFIESIHGKLNLLDKAGHVYTVNHRNRSGEKIYWTCREYSRKRNKQEQGKCPGRVTTQGIHIIAKTGTHNHEVMEH